MNAISGKPTVDVGGESNPLMDTLSTQDIVPALDVTYDIGRPAKRVKTAHMQVVDTATVNATNVNASADVTVLGALVVGGEDIGDKTQNIVAGATETTINSTLSVAGDVIPFSTSYDLGTSGVPWATTYTDSAIIGSITCDTINGATTDTSLQQAYNNSLAPEITTNSTLGALSIKNGTGTATDNVLEIINTSGVVVGAITGEGALITSNLNVDSTYVRIGDGAGSVTQAANAIAIGELAGETNQGGSSVAIGTSAAKSTQAANCVAIGAYAGSTSQENYCTAVGRDAGKSNQKWGATAIGSFAGRSTQSTYAVAVGNSAGYNLQGAYAVAVGSSAGYGSQGANSIMIGKNAGVTSSAGNSICLNASGVALNPAVAGFHAAPVRAVGGTIATPTTGLHSVYYDPATKEFVLSTDTHP